MRRKGAGKMKFLHTADWQIGMRAAHIGKHADVVRRVRFEAAERVVAIANERAADAMLVTGDTFEDNAVSSVDVQRVADILARFRGSVYVIPGNHDPAVAASLWQHPAWRRDGLHVLLEESPIIAAPGVTLFPCPLKTKASSIDPTAWIAEATGDGVRVGLAHGTVVGATVTEDVFPIPRDAAARGRLDFLALGHWHSTASFSEPLETARMAYAGTHETTKFGERDSGNVLLIDIRERGTVPIVERIRTGSLTWLDIARTIRSDVDLQAVVDEIDALENPASTLVALRLTGTLHPSALPQLRHVRDILAARFAIFAQIDDSGLIPEPTDNAWVDRLPIGMMRNVALRLLRESDANADAARRALIELYAIAQKDLAA
jgi:DNA repair exonuclease SbcCD nuclease subunit